MTNDSESEVDRWRRAAKQAGLRENVRPEDVGVELLDSDAMLQRVKNPVADDDRPARSVSITRRSRRAIVIGSAAAAVLAVMTLVNPWTDQQVAADTPPVLDYQFADAQDIAYAPGQDAQAAFLSLADAARSQAAPSDGPVQHVVTASWVATLDSSTSVAKAALVPRLSETWLTADGSLYTVEHRGTPLAADGRGVPIDGSWNDEPRSDEDVAPPGTIDADLIDDLPDDVAHLRAFLLTSGSCVGAESAVERGACLYNDITNIYRNLVVPPKVAATLWTVLAGESDFRLLGRVKDRAGREGVGITMRRSASARYRLVMIISPSNGLLLGTEEILVKTRADLDLTAPAITGFTAILESRRTATSPRR